MMRKKSKMKIKAVYEEPQQAQKLVQDYALEIYASLLLKSVIKNNNKSLDNLHLKN